MAAVVLGGAIASLYAVRADSSEQTVAAAVSNTSPLFPSSFPIAVWLQNPDQTTKIESGYSTLARAAAAEGINTFLGLNDWPSAFGVDNSTSGQGAQFQAACNAGEHVVAGGNSSSNTAANSVASVEFIAALERQAGTGTSCSQYLAGYNWTDEPPACSNNVAAQVAAIHAEDPTRPTIDNMASWVSWGDSGCTSSADAAFAAPAITSSDDYHNTDAWNVTNAEGGCEGAQHVSTSPWADCSWLYGYQAAVQASLSGGKPTWVFLETGTDELGFSSQSGSSCNTSTNTCSNGNEYNATAPQVNANAWAAIINGASGIEWFCHGAAQGQGTSDSDCMGGNGSASNAIFSNLQYIDGTVQGYAPALLSATQGACTMQPSTYSTRNNALLQSCSGGDLTMSTSNTSEPIMAMTKVVNGTTYLFVEADRANGTTTGTYGVAGAGGDTASLVYDSAAHYDPAVSEQGHTFSLNGSGTFSDSLRGDNGEGSNHYGAGSNGYEVKIYTINTGSPAPPSSPPPSQGVPPSQEAPLSQVAPSSHTAVGIASTPDGGGYWIAYSNGAVFPHGDAEFYGGVSNLTLNAPVDHIVSTPDGRGYWLIAADGGTFSEGDAQYYGSTSSLRLNAPVVDMTPTPDGGGYWLVASDGGVFSYGDAQFYGSTGGMRLNQSVVGMATDRATGGYWLVARDGGIFAFNAPFYGSTGGIHLSKPVNGMAATPNGLGYWFVASDGGVFNYGVAPFHGSAGSLVLNAPVVGMAPDPATGGYWLVGSDGGLFSFDAPFLGTG